MLDPSSTEIAREHLSYIRRTLEAAGQFTAVPGKGLMAAGIAALAGVEANVYWTGAPWAGQADPRPALVVWAAVLTLSVAVLSWGIHRKAGSMRMPIQPPLLRRLLWSLCPALFVGGLLTHHAVRAQSLEWLPVIWLGSYGAAVANSGLVSVLPVRWMGICLLLCAAGAALSPPGMGLTWIAVGFGWLHLVFGAFIAWRHNG
jgi:hypothetical protein